MSDTESAFQRYWRNLQETNPAEYEARLERNRERIRKMRSEIYADPERHKMYLERERERYRRRREAASS